MGYFEDDKLKGTTNIYRHDAFCLKQLASDIEKVRLPENGEKRAEVVKRLQEIAYRCEAFEPWEIPQTPPVPIDRSITIESEKVTRLLVFCQALFQDGTGDAGLRALGHLGRAFRSLCDTSDTAHKYLDKIECSCTQRH